MSTGIVILAAGSSSRLGQPKQLLDFKGSSLLNRIISESVMFSGEAVVVVTGFEHELMAQNIAGKVLVCHNPNWAEGMASSIEAGLKHLLLAFPELRSCIITVCDQPHLDAGVFRQMAVEQQKSGKGIVASYYSATAGVPALFNWQYFDALLHLKGQEGARKLFTTFKDDTALVPFEKGAIDIDTIEDYNKLIS